MAKQEGDGRSIAVERRVAAPPERAFDAWIVPEVAGRWLFADKKDGSACELDARVGGRYRITRTADGQSYVAVGEYVEVNRPARLVFTYGMPQFSPEFATVTVGIEPDGAAGSRVRVVQDSVPEGYEDALREGWEEMFDMLEAALLA